jgi:hypothetical protein
MKAGVFQPGPSQFAEHHNVWCRSFKNIGVMSSGSTQTVTGLNLAVSAGDLWGIYDTTGRISTTSNIGDHCFYKVGDQFDGLEDTYTVARPHIKTGAFGITNWTNIAKVNGVAFVDMAKINSVEKSVISKVNGIAV